MWTYNQTPQYIKDSEELGLSEDLKNRIKDWAQQVQRYQTNRTKLFFRSPHNIFEIWDGRIPDPDSNRGSSGGFRLVYFFNLQDKAVYVDKIERRGDLGGKHERPKDQQKMNKYLDTLKKYLLSELDPS